MHFLIAGLVPGLIAFPVIGLITMPFVVIAASIARRVRRRTSERRLRAGEAA